MKKLVYALLVALVGSPPAFAQSEDTVDETEMTAEDEADKPQATAEERAPLTEDEAAAIDAAKAELEALDQEDAKPGDEAG